ncbi:hypothetical protein ACIBF5_15825 [Micromonospora sp. NPDC050417]|uniref:hypothetical protein n=1 Tax=Micromonospora sp. NPDC050417 TaxID=3364280 RepID=UPI0037A39CBF
MSDSYPTPPRTETKVKAAATAGAGAAAVITPFAVWLIDLLAFNGDAPPDVPLPVVGVIGLIVTGLAAWGAGYWAKHTARPDLPSTQR